MRTFKHSFVHLKIQRLSMRVHYQESFEPTPTRQIAADVSILADSTTVFGTEPNQSYLSTPPRLGDSFSSWSLTLVLCTMCCILKVNFEKFKQRASNFPDSPWSKNRPKLGTFPWSQESLCNMSAPKSPCAWSTPNKVYKRPPFLDNPPSSDVWFQAGLQTSAYRIYGDSQFCLCITRGGSPCPNTRSAVWNIEDKQTLSRLLGTFLTS